MDEIKTILCFGDSNTYGYDPVSKKRYSKEIRWPKRLERLLENKYEIIEEGCNGRTTVFADPKESWKRGIDHIKPCINSHKPVDIIIMMLGSNDLKKIFNASAKDIAEGNRQIIKVIKEFSKEKQNYIPEIILISPPKIGENIKTSSFSTSFDMDAVEKSRDFSDYYTRVAMEEGVHFLDADKVIESSKVDSLHLDPEAHKKLADALYSFIIDLEFSLYG